MFNVNSECQQDLESLTSLALGDQNSLETIELKRLNYSKQTSKQTFFFQNFL